MPLVANEFEMIPAQMKDRMQWVVWKLEQNKGKPTKIPYQINGSKAISTNPATWTSYDKAIDTFNDGQYNGIGYVLTSNDEYIGIDLDDCITGDKANPEALTIVKALNSYTEYSQSGTGLHIIIKGKKPGSRSKNPEKNVEIYDSGRFLIMTGNHVEGTPNTIEKRQNEIDKIYNHYFPKKESKPKPVISTSNELTDQDILSIGFKAKNGGKFSELYAGNWGGYGSQSEADQALCNYIAFYTQDTEQIDRIFSDSGLHRDKWDREDYKTDTIENAIDGLNETYKSNRNDDFQLNVEGMEESVIIPKPFTVLNESLYSIKKAKNENENDQTIFVSRNVPILAKEFHNVERPQLLYEITWKQGNKKISEVVPASTIAIKKELLELSEKGFSVNDNNSKSLISFMDFYLLENEIDQHYAVERLGNIKDKFIHPILTNDVEIMALDQGEKQLLEGFEVKGTSETWKREVFERIKDQPKAVFMVLSSFASVIIKDLGIKPFITETSGNSSQGKTTALEIGSTVWGNKSLISEWNATRVSIERKAAYLNSYPLLIDDTRKADERVLQSIIYQFSGGRSKGRGSLKGSQKEYTWNNIMLSTGEVSLNEYAKNAGGVAARVIPLGDEPLRNDSENIIQLQEAMKENYGAIGIDFLKAWIQNKDDLIPEFHKVRKLYAAKSKGNNVLSRLSEFYAAVHFTGLILIDHLGMDIKLNDLVKLFDSIAQENKAIDKPLQFLEEILTDLDSSRNEIFYEHEPQVITKAIYKNNHLYLMPSYTKRFLGAEEPGTRKEWLKRGVSIGRQLKGIYVDHKQLKHKGSNYRVIPVNMERVKELGFDLSYSDK